MKSKKVLVLGGTGMLGAMICDYFMEHTDFTVASTYNKHPSDKLSWNGRIISCYHLNVSENIDLQDDIEKIVSDFSPNFIINCIGLIKNYCNDPSNSLQTFLAVNINAVFPFVLSKVVAKLSNSIKIIQIATDCVYDGVKGEYNENDSHNALDVYGKTKSLGEIIAPNFLNIRCSIIGPEINNKSSLLEWFLGSRDGSKIAGFDHHYWNGVTTLQFAKYCQEIIVNDKFMDLRKLNHCVHLVCNESVTKYELLNIFNSSFGRSVIIDKIYDPKNKVDRTISSVFLNINLESMQKSIDELFSYIEKSKVFKIR